MRQQSSPAPTTAAASPPPCSHHWIIEEATGPSSAGVCRHCGARREFRNYVEAPYWNEEKARHREQTRLSQAAAARPEDDYADF